MINTETYLKEMGKIINSKTKKREYLTILDFETGKVHRYDVYPNKQHEEHEDFILGLGFSLCDIEWMVHKDPKIY